MRDTLIKAREILAKGQWTQGGCYAADPHGVAMNYNYADAETCHFCMLGALGVVNRTADILLTETPESLALARALDPTADRDTTFDLVTEFNDADTTTLADVLAVFDKAIADA
ncbi:DUF6197 family protein [Sphingomonas jaspsi]|uniref:DUF6197 family protein n=1 Tax=Sphingomonas jaspsi TaxID=392409 RepID=UPI00056A89D0|nr:hypothetical protein [Sphingomonas jaspsi]